MNTTDTWIEIPDEVRELYKVWTTDSVGSCHRIGKTSLDTPAHIYFKNESVRPDRFT